MAFKKLATLRSAGVLGDQNPSTGQTVTEPVPGSGAVAMSAIPIDDSADLGTIGYLVFAAVARVRSASPPTSWAESRIQFDTPSTGHFQAIRVPAWPTEGATPEVRSTGPVFTHPSGTPWGWAHVNDLVVELQQTWTQASGAVSLDGYEVFVEVWGGSTIDASLQAEETEVLAGGPEAAEAEQETRESSEMSSGGADASSAIQETAEASGVVLPGPEAS